MSLHTDSHFAIGAGHTVCQDYALHGKLPYAAYIMGSDGCSSSKKSELGARLICESARKLLEVNDRMISPDYLRQSIIQELRQLKSVLRLNTENFDATFWLAVATESGYSIMGWGDGVVRKEFDNGEVVLDHIEFTSNAPRYLSYGLNAERYASYLEASKGHSVIHTTYLDGKLIETKNEPVDGYFFYEENEIGGGGKRITNISIMSDGINTFKTTDGTILFDAPAMSEEVCDFVNLKGVFVERQMKWLSTQHKKKGIVHVDDLFCASMEITPTVLSPEDQRLMQEAVESLRPKK